MSSLRIAFMANARTGNGFHRGFGPMLALAARGHRVTEVVIGEKSATLAKVRGVDVLHVHRYYSRDMQRVIREAKAHGAAIVWDDDDDFEAVPKEMWSRDHGMGKARWLAEVKQVLALADVATTPSETLAERFRERGARCVRIVENYLPASLLRALIPPHEGITIGWFAGKEHRIEAEQMPLAATLQRVLEQRPDVSVTTIGVPLEIQSDRYRRIERVKYLPEGRPPNRVTGGLLSHVGQFDVGIAPLVDIPLNRSRSNIKLKEYAAAGTAWLASPVGPYVGLGEEQGGRLVSDDQWHEAVLRLVDKSRERRKLVKQGVKWAQTQTLERNIRRWEDVLFEAVERARAAGG